MPTTEHDAELAKWLKTARGGRRLMFAYIAKGQGGKLLIGKKIAPQAIADAKKEVGSNTVIKGKCVGEQGTLFFEVAKDVPQAMPLQVKRAIKQATGMTIDCLVRVQGDAEPLETEDEGLEDETEAVESRPQAKTQPPVGPHDLTDSETTPPPAPPRPGTPEAAARIAVVKRLNALKDDIKTILSNRAPEASRVQTLVTAVNGLLNNQDVEQAGKVLDELEPIVKQSAGTRVPEEPTEDSIVKRLNALTSDLKTAIAEKGPNVARIQMLFVAANGLIKNDDFVQAAKVLDELEPLLGRPKRTTRERPVTSGAQQPPTPPPPPGSTEGASRKPPPAPDPGTLLDRRLATLRKGFDVAVARTKEQGTGKDQELEAAMRRIEEARQAGRISDAFQELTALDALVKATLKEAVAGKKPPEPAPLIKYKMARLRWDRARSFAQGELDRLADLMLAHPEVTEDPRYSEIQDAAKRLPEKLPKFDGTLEKALDILHQTTDPAQRGQAREAVKKAIERYASVVGSSTDLADLEETPFGKTNVRGEYTAAFDEIRELIGA